MEWASAGETCLVISHLWVDDPDLLPRSFNIVISTQEFSPYAEVYGRYAVVGVIELRSVLAIVTTIVACLVTGCSGDAGSSSATTTRATPTSRSTTTPASQPTSPSSRPELTISGNAFSALAPVKPNAVVHVHNVDNVSHNVVSEDGAFRTPDLAPGEDATFVAPRARGSYRFRCTLQPGMHGVLIVGQRSGETRAPSSRTAGTTEHSSGGPARSTSGPPRPSGY